MPSRPPAVAVAGAIARELEASFRTAMYPFNRFFPLPEPAPLPDRRPVILVHGYMGHPGMMQPLARHLLDHGFPRVDRIGYPAIGVTFDEIVRRIALAVDAIEGPVDLVGHSLGAVACRAYVKLHGGDARVERFVAMAAPFGGTSLYRFVLGGLREPLDPHGGTIKRLAEGEELVPTTIIRARFDHQILPSDRGRIDGIEEIVLDGLGHNGLLCSRRAHVAVERALTRPR
jgi:pimeloyl-ACP methyl ester carboxylesterase